MDINIYSKYHVAVHGTGTFVDNEASTSDDVVFTDVSGSNTCTMEGGELLDMLAEEMQSVDTDIVVFKKNCIFISQFNPRTGEVCETTYNIEKIDDETN